MCEISKFSKNLCNFNVRQPTLFQNIENSRLQKLIFHFKYCKITQLSNFSIILFSHQFLIKAIKLINHCFQFERASFRSSGGRGVDRLLVMENRDALVKGRPCYRESRYRESRVYFILTSYSAKFSFSHY